MPPVEAWVKVFMGDEGGEAFMSDPVHGILDCIDCHGGSEGRNTKEVAHAGLDFDPSEGENNKCADLCHNDEKTGHFWEDSVHATQVGYKTLFEARAGMPIEGHPELEAGFATDCSACHASCGDCHISQPKNVGGGLIAGHRINKTPSVTRNCTACHGSRVGDEWFGNNDYAGFDVHYIPNRMDCFDCHTGQEMHGTPGANPLTRYQEPNMPRCEDCHGSTLTDTMQDNAYHAAHLDPNGSTLQCQTCHSQQYKSCNSCHVGEGITGSSYATFKIGLNPIETERDYEYVLLRHIPVSEDTFEGWGLANLDEYDAVPTWKYASPHNIRRLGSAVAEVDENGQLTGEPTCSNCHTPGIPEQAEDVFLRQRDLDELPAAEQAANQNVIVPDENFPSMTLDETR